MPEEYSPEQSDHVEFIAPQKQIALVSQEDNYKIKKEQIEDIYLVTQVIPEENDLNMTS